MRNKISNKELLSFYDDGLKDCSWIPSDKEGFLQYCNTKNIAINSSGDMLILTSGDKDFLYLDTIYVIKSKRGKGLATRAIENLSGRVILLCNKVMTPFYEKFGFLESEKLPYKVMIKNR